ncbi:hypothetical protein ITJ57_18940 [Plantibacter sp. VKM Ac-2880]|uniref:hypothetical protein n=1 Tax=Plantibacter sp. VKM Ac-2880 TaxID=2783827 RepID=UPI00188DE7C5|nr:hypothetical protein [Plantibacter sp. VKM Ac-2880]MBF4570850.1 hypothetical protein [Plantibacter sp. VKM Ac-2880]
MNQHDLNNTLHALDAAPEPVLDDTARRRVANGLDQILASTPEHVDTGRRPLRRWALPLVGLAAATVTGMALISTITPTPAYASWTPTPVTLTAAELAIAGPACTSAGGRPDADVVLAERRGEWVAIAALTDEPGTISCLLYLPEGAMQAEHVSAGFGGGQGAIPTAGQFTGGSIAQFSETGFLGIAVVPTVAIVVGDVGPDVTAVDITITTGDVVTATVADGHYIAWWPGSAFGDGTEGNGGPRPDLRYRLTLVDGRTIDNAQATLPQ